MTMPGPTPAHGLTSTWGKKSQPEAPPEGQSTMVKYNSQQIRSQRGSPYSFLSQHNNTRSHTSLKTVEHIANFSRTVLPNPLYSLDLASLDFHLFGLMRDGLYGLHFPRNDTIIPAAKQWVTSTGADYYERDM